MGFLVSELLVSRYPMLLEGALSKMKAYLVSANHLHEVAARLDLGKHLLLGKGEELSGGREKRALLADSIEAVMAAMYLDGGMEPVRKFVVTQVIGSFDAGGQEALVVDYKSALQEASQAMGLPMPKYVIVKSTGPEHKKKFTVEARVGLDYVSRAEGMSKKEAGQKAARQLLERLVAPPVEGGAGSAATAE